MILESIGWISSICFAICGAPQAWNSYREKHSRGLTWSFLSLWFIGEIGSFIYVLPLMKWPLLTNYIFNIVFILVILYYKIVDTQKSKNKIKS